MVQLFDRRESGRNLEGYFLKPATTAGFALNAVPARVSQMRFMNFHEL